MSDPDLQMDLHSSGTTEQDVDQEVLCGWLQFLWF